jgi:hypothetical protein
LKQTGNGSDIFSSASAPVINLPLPALPLPLPLPHHWLLVILITYMVVVLGPDPTKATIQVTRRTEEQTNRPSAKQRSDAHRHTVWGVQRGRRQPQAAPKQP